VLKSPTSRCSALIQGQAYDTVPAFGLLQLFDLDGTFGGDEHQDKKTILIILNSQIGRVRREV